MKRLTSIFLSIALSTVLVFLTGCSTGISQAEYDKVVDERDALQEELSSLNLYRVSPNDENAIREIIQQFKTAEIPISYEIVFDKSNDPNGSGLQSYLAKGSFSDSNCEPVFSKSEPISGTIEIFDSYESAKARADDLEEKSSNENKYNYNVIKGNVLLRLNSRFSKEYAEKYIEAFGGELHSILKAPVNDVIEWPSDQVENSKEPISSSNKAQPTPSSFSSPAKKESASTKEVVAPTSEPKVFKETMGQKNALSKAKSYLDYTAFSYKGLVEQLEYEKFSSADAIYGADNCGANWNEQAAKKAKSYLDFTSFSRDSLIEQLVYEGFTQEQAEYGANAVGY